MLMLTNFLSVLALETFYSLLIIIPCLIIFFRFSNMYRFSNYKGLKYVKNAFLFFVVAFFLRYLVMLNRLFVGEFTGTIADFNALLFLMIFFMTLPGFFLLYSLIWKKFEVKKYSSKPLNLQVSIIYLLAIIVALFDYLNHSFLFMYSSQIIVYFIASVIAYKNYVGDKKLLKQFYLIAMLLLLVAMILNLIAQYTIDAFPQMRLYTYALTVLVIFVFLKISKGLDNG